MYTVQLHSGNCYLQAKERCFVGVMYVIGDQTEERLFEFFRDNTICNLVMKGRLAFSSSRVHASVPESWKGEETTGVAGVWFCSGS